MNILLVSIIMPVFNGEKYLREAIESVLRQTYRNFEFIIINDCSTDRTEEIILSYSDPRIRYYKNEKNLHVAETLNRCISLAKGDFIARMDADDICMPKRIECQVRYLQKHSDLDGCGTWAIKIDSGGRKTGFLRGYLNSEMAACSALFTVPFVHPSVMFRSPVIRKELYNMNIRGAGQDLELWSRLSIRGYRFNNIPIHLLKYRIHSENVSSKNNTRIYEITKRALSPSLNSFFDRELSENEFVLHRYSFFIISRELRNIVSEDIDDLVNERNWLEYVYKQNSIKGIFNQSVFRSFLIYRWLICCVLSHNIKILNTIRIGRIGFLETLLILRFLIRI